MNIYSWTSINSIIPDIEQDESSLNSYCFNKYNTPLPIIIPKINYYNISNLKFNDTIDKSQSILIKEENQTEIDQKFFEYFIENDHNKKKNFFFR